MIFFLFSFHCVRAFSGSHRVVSFEAEKSELEFLKAWSYLEIIGLRPHPDPTGGLPRSGGFNWPFRGTKHTVSEEEPGGAAFVWRLFAYGK